MNNGFRISRPQAEHIAAFLAQQSDARFSYPEVGATAGEPPPGYRLNHRRVRLGSGEAVFERAAQALRDWRMASLGWCEVFPAGAPIAQGSVIAMIVGHYGFWSMNACRIVYVLDDAGAGNGTRRVGFAYGTLPSHAAIGEERFTVEWRRDDDSVWYDLLAFSRPGHPLTRLGYPLVRRLQRRFGQASQNAMVAAVVG